jgi:hypothetical protein
MSTIALHTERPSAAALAPNSPLIRPALAALAEALGPRGGLVLPEGERVSSADIRLMAMGLKEQPALGGGDLRPFSWFCARLVQTAKASELRNRDVALPKALVDLFTMHSTLGEPGASDFTLTVSPAAAPVRLPPPAASPPAPTNKADALAAIQQDPALYFRLPPALQADKDVALATIMSAPDSVAKMPNTIRDSVDIALEVVKRSPLPIDGFSAAARNDPRVKQALLQADVPDALSAGIDQAVLDDFAAFEAGAPLSSLTSAKTAAFAALCATSQRLLGDEHIPLGGDRSGAQAYADVTAWLLRARIDAELVKSPLIQELVALEQLAKTDPDAARRLASLKTRVRAADIRWPERFSSLAMLERVLRDGEKPDARPVALVLAARWDPNGFTASDEWDRQLGQTHRIVYKEVSTKQDVLHALLDQKGYPASKGWVMAHGQPTGMKLGAGPDGALMLDDVLAFGRRGAGQAFKAGADIYLDSCSTGGGRNKAANMGNAFSRLAPQASIHAPDEEALRSPTTEVDGIPPAFVPFVGQKRSLLIDARGRATFLGSQGVRPTYEIPARVNAR